MAEDKRIRKAYDNREFLHGRSARHLRVLAEFIEPEERLRKHGIHNTIVFFGSSMAVDNRTFELCRNMGLSGRATWDSLRFWTMSMRPSSLLPDN